MWRCRVGTWLAHRTVTNSDAQHLSYNRGQELARRQSRYTMAGTERESILSILLAHSFFNISKILQVTPLSRSDLHQPKRAYNNSRSIASLTCHSSRFLDFAKFFNTMSWLDKIVGLMKT